METEYIYQEDIVFQKTKHGYEIGTVRASHCEFSPDFESDQEDEIAPGYAEVEWYPSTHGKATVQIKQLALAERSLMPGDIVRSFESVNKKGVVTNCTIMSIVQVYGMNKIIEGIDTTLLELPAPHDDDMGDAVYVELDGWVGRADYGYRMNLDRRCLVTIEFPDGAIGKVQENDLIDRLDDQFNHARGIARDYDYYAITSFFKGKRLHGKPWKEVYTNSIDWIKKGPTYNDQINKTDASKPVFIKVLDVEPMLMRVKWEGTASNPAKPKPKSLLNQEDIKRLRYVDPHVSMSHQVGDLLYYTVRAGDVIEQITPIADNSLVRQVLQRHLAPTFAGTLIAYVTNHCNQKNSASNQPQDGNGSISNGQSIPGDAGDEWVDEVDESANNSIRNRHKNRVHNKKSAKLFKFERRQKHMWSGEIKPNDVVPVVILYSQTFADILWQDGTIDKEINSVFVCPLHNLDDGEFFPGDYVINVEDEEKAERERYGVIQSMDALQRTATVKWMFSDRGKLTPICIVPSEEVSVYEIKDHPIFSQFRQGTIVLRNHIYDEATILTREDDTVGAVSSINTDGTMSVRWANGCLSHCFPEQLHVIANPRDEDTDEDDDDDDEDLEYDSVEEMLYDDDDNGESSDSGDSHVSTADSDMDAEDVDEDDEHEGVDWEFPDRFSDIDDSAADLVQLLTKFRPQLVVLAEQQPYSDKVAEDVIREISNITKLVTEVVKLRMMPKSPSQDATDDSEPHRVREIVPELENLTAFMKTVKVGRRLSDALVEIRKSLESDSPQVFYPIACAEFLSIMVNKNVLKVLNKYNNSDEEGHQENEFVKKSLEVVNLVTELDKLMGEDGQESTTPKPLQDLRAELQAKIRELTELQKQYTAETAVSQCADVVNKIYSIYHDNREVALSPSQDNDVSDSGPKEPLTDGEDSEPSTKTEPSSSAQTRLSDSSVNPQPIKLEATTGGNLEFLESCPQSHHYSSCSNQEQLAVKNVKTISNHLQMLNTNLPDGIIVKAFEDRMDCLSAMIKGPANTPYEDGLFIFDLLLPPNYPSRPLKVRYISYCQERLNPNLYTDGKVCTSLLGTWHGKDEETWKPNQSNILQVLISLQALILTSEPYYNEAGFHVYRGTNEGAENSKHYNEMVLIKLLQSMIRMIECPHECFTEEMKHHWRFNQEKFLQRLKGYMKMEQSEEMSASAKSSTGFPLLPLSRGCILAMEKQIDKFYTMVATLLS